MEPVTATTLGFELMLPPRGSRELLRSLHAQLRDAILQGRLHPGVLLPSSRQLAQACGVSRNTAMAAYDLLASEAYVVTRPGGGTYVTAVAPRPHPPRKPAATPDEPDARLSALWRAARAPSPLASAPWAFDFAAGLPDKALFPFDLWRRLSARALRGLSRTPAAYAEPQGRETLRQAIARHVSFTRAVACSADDIIVTSGAQQAFDLLARILVTSQRSLVALEEPGYPPLRRAFQAAGARLAFVPVDGQGLDVARLPAGASIVCVTPSHQFPLGMALSAPRRTALLEFAQARQAVVIEDDYDGEFRYGGRPLDALQTLDQGRCVFYVGTFSKSLFPALRLGYVVAPAWARPALLAAKQASDWHCAVLQQDTLAAFIHEGHLLRHVRKMRKVYGQRRAVMLEALARHGQGRLSVVASDSGLHLACALRGDIDAVDLSQRAARQGLRVWPLADFAGAQPPLNGLVLGYGAVPAERIDAGVRQLCGLLV